MGLHVSKPAGSSPEAILPEPAKTEGIEDAIVSIDISGASLLTSNVFSSNDLTDIPTVVADYVGAGESTVGAEQKTDEGSAEKETEKEKGESGKTETEKGESAKKETEKEKGESAETETEKETEKGKSAETETEKETEKGKSAKTEKETEEFSVRDIFSENDEMEELLKKDESAEKEDSVKTGSSDPEECPVCSCLCRRFKQSFIFTTKFQSVYTGLSSELEELYGESSGIYAGINHLPPGAYVPDQVIMVNIRKRKNV
jgi:cobalamin biosynthesis protein CobT